MSEHGHDENETPKKHRHKGGHGHGGGGHEEGHEGAPEWLISFADMVMLMMGFFVILFALNVKPMERAPGGMTDDSEQSDAGATAAEMRMLDFAIAVRESFNNPVSLDSKDPLDAALVRRLLERAGKSETRDPGVRGFEQEVQSIRPSEYESLCGTVPFSDFKTEMSPGSNAVIEQIARKVRGLRMVIEVRGHTSGAEARQSEDAAMRLASERALAVARELSQAGVDWWQMRLVICADHDRIESFPKNAQADRANARVDVVVTDEIAPERAPSGQSG